MKIWFTLIVSQSYLNSSEKPGSTDEQDAEGDWLFGKIVDKVVKVVAIERCVVQSFYYVKVLDSVWLVKWSRQAPNYLLRQ